MTGAPRGASPSLAAAGLQGLCPRCGARSLFAGPVRFADQCDPCGLDFDAFNVGDGPAAFLILLVGAILTPAALLVELAYGPPWWVHLVWIPAGIALTILGLRIGKAMLLRQEYAFEAREGRLG